MCAIHLMLLSDTGLNLHMKNNQGYGADTAKPKLGWVKTYLTIQML